MKEKLEKRINELRELNRNDRELLKWLDINNPRDQKLMQDTKTMILMRCFANRELEKIIKEMEKK